MNQNPEPVEIDLKEDSRSLYIFFGGIALGIAMPPFEFYNASNILDESRVFVRDLDQCWYQRGLRGITHDVPSTVDYLKRLIDQSKADQVHFIGNSMGGFAALMFSAIIGAGRCVAFAPQTSVEPITRLTLRDFRWQRQMLALYRANGWRCPYYDVRPWCLSSSNDSEALVFVSRQDRPDIANARRLAGVSSVTVCEMNGGGHGLVRVLKEKGVLPELMTGNFDPSKFDESLNHA